VSAHGVDYNLAAPGHTERLLVVAVVESQCADRQAPASCDPLRVLEALHGLNNSLASAHDSKLLTLG